MIYKKVPHAIRVFSIRLHISGKDINTIATVSQEDKAQENQN